MVAGIYSYSPNNTKSANVKTFSTVFSLVPVYVLLVAIRPFRSIWSIRPSYLPHPPQFTFSLFTIMYGSFRLNVVYSL